jgi:hypothetical protein
MSYLLRAYNKEDNMKVIIVRKWIDETVSIVESKNKTYKATRGNK